MSGLFDVGFCGVVIGGVKIKGKAKFGCGWAWKNCWLCPLLPVVVKTNDCWGNGWVFAACPVSSGWGNIAAGWNKGVPEGKPNVAGANEIYY